MNAPTAWGRSTMNAHSLSLLSMLTNCLKGTLSNNISIVKVDNFLMSNKQGTTSTIYFLTVSYIFRGTKHDKEFVLKIYREGFERIAEKEVYLLKALKQQGLPVPSAYCSDANNGIINAPFIIMEKITGNSVAQCLNTDSDGKAIVDGMAENLVRIHKFNKSCLENSEELQEVFEMQKRHASQIQFFVKKYCTDFLGFCPYRQRKFIKAVRRLEDVKPQELGYVLLHLDYGPDHILISNGKFVILDWGQAAIGDPAFDVAWAYHKLRLGREGSKVDLGKYFVRSYELHMGERLVNLQFYKDLVAVEMASRFLCSPFNENILHNYAKLFDISFGNVVGSLLNIRATQRLRNILKNHHTEIWRNIEYIQNYAIRYLETDRYSKT